LLSIRIRRCRAPVLERARLVRIMKTVAAISEKAESSSIKRLARTLASQLVELMPGWKVSAPGIMSVSGAPLDNWAASPSDRTPTTSGATCKSIAP